MIDTVVTEIVKQIFMVAGAVIASGTVTTLLTQLLKWRFIPIPAQKYPVTVAVIVSLLVSAGALLTLNLVVFSGWVSYIIFAGATILVATQSYDLVHDALTHRRNNASS